MRDIPIGNLMRAVRTVTPDDVIGKAAELLRVSGTTEVPVVSGGRLAGVLTEAAVLDALKSGDAGAVAEEPISGIISRDMVCVNPYVPIGQVAEIMSERDLSAVPVVDEYGNYLGLACRSDVNSALSLMIRPPTVAGMATPLGVYLTTGHLRAGAGDVGLMLSGVGMVALLYGSLAVIMGLAWLLDRSGLFAPWSLLALMQSEPIRVANWMDTVRSIMLGLSIPIFLVLLRMSSVAGYHAAEHQVVHAIESGEPLKPANVMAMPRVHPRCGTNIVAGVMLFLLVTEATSLDVAVPIFVFGLILAWRVIGGYFQYYVTTRPPNRKQLESGISAGESLIRQYRSNPGYRVTGWRRVWNTGMPQVMLGAAAASSLAYLLAPSMMRFL